MFFIVRRFMPYASASLFDSRILNCENLICRGIEEVITGLTRNQFVPKHTRVRIPPSAPKNKDTPCGCPLFFASIGGDELSFAKRKREFAYRRHIAYHEAQSIRGICVARRCLSQVTLCGTLSTILAPSSIPLPLRQAEKP